MASGMGRTIARPMQGAGAQSLSRSHSLLYLFNVVPAWSRTRLSPRISRDCNLNFRPFLSRSEPRLPPKPAQAASMQSKSASTGFLTRSNPTRQVRRDRIGRLPHLALWERSHGDSETSWRNGSRRISAGRGFTKRSYACLFVAHPQLALTFHRRITDTPTYFTNCDVKCFPDPHAVHLHGHIAEIFPERNLPCLTATLTHDPWSFS